MEVWYNPSKRIRLSLALVMAEELCSHIAEFFKIVSISIPATFISIGADLGYRAYSIALAVLGNIKITMEGLEG